MYEIGLDGCQDPSESMTRRGNRNTHKAADAAAFDFDACELVSELALRNALLTRSSEALDYISDVISDLEINAEVCSHLVHMLSRTPDTITFLTEVKRRCLIKNVFTHSVYMQASFLDGSVRVRVSDVSEKAAKQAAHIEFVKRFCERVLADDEGTHIGNQPVLSAAGSQG